VLSGTLHSQAHVWNTTRNADERIGQLLLLHGKEQEAIGELKAGEIGAVAKLSETETGDTLATKEKPYALSALEFPEPTLVVAIEPQTKADLDKMGPALQRMLERSRQSGSNGVTSASSCCGRSARRRPRSSSSA
jgi:elongation factor G